MTKNKLFTKNNQTKTKKMNIITKSYFIITGVLASAMVVNAIPTDIFNHHSKHGINKIEPVLMQQNSINTHQAVAKDLLSIHKIVQTELDADIQEQIKRSFR